MRRGLIPLREHTAGGHDLNEIRPVACVDAAGPPHPVHTIDDKVNARLLQMQDQLGTLESGKLADVLLVDGRPDEDIRILRHSDHVKLVIQDGRIVKNAMPDKAKA